MDIHTKYCLVVHRFVIIFLFDIHILNYFPPFMLFHMCSYLAAQSQIMICSFGRAHLSVFIIGLYRLQQLNKWFCREGKFAYSLIMTIIIFFAIFIILYWNKNKVIVKIKTYFPDEDEQNKIIGIKYLFNQQIWFQ